MTNVIPFPLQRRPGHPAITTSGEPCEVLGCRAGLVLIQYQNGERIWADAGFVIMGEVDDRWERALSVMHGSYDLPSDTEAL